MAKWHQTKRKVQNAIKRLTKWHSVIYNLKG